MAASLPYLEEAFEVVVSGSRPWARFRTEPGFDSRTAEEVLSSLGHLRPTRSGGKRIDFLTPATSDLAHPRSLSARFGEGVFPAHIDGAHCPVPPRILALWCEVDEQSRPTLLLPWSTVAARIPRPDRMFREVFWIRSGRDSFLDSILSERREFARLDPGCMEPATRNAAALLSEVLCMIDGCELDRIEWVPGLGVIINNWRALHARGATKHSGKRLLGRAWIDPLNLKEAR